MALIASSKGNGLIDTLQPGVRRDGPLYNTADMQPKDTEFSTHGLPKAFLHSLRTLFDILDDGRRGYVHLSEIESRWRGAEARDLPAGVLESLRRVAPRHGCLTFERFVAGLRYSMFNPENGSKPLASNHRQPLKSQQRTGAECKVRPLGPSNGINTVHSRNRHGSSVYSDKHSDSSRYSGVSGRSECSYRSDQIHIEQNAHHVRSIESPDGPNTVESLALPRSQSESTTGFTRSRRHTRSRDPQRRHTITNGVDYGMGNEEGVVYLRHSNRAQSRRGRSVEAAVTPCGVAEIHRLGPRGLDAAVWAAYTTVFIPLSSSLFSSRALHFYLWLKQMKELEQEKDSLLAGLDVLERARDWYQTQIHNITETQRHVGQSRHSTEFLAESRLDVLLPKLQEVTRCLSDLISSSGKTFPSSGSLSSGGSSSAAPPQAIHTLKEHNRLLTQEVTEKSERITQLEQEKSALIKQLFEARARSAHDSSVLDSTFI